MAIFDRIVNFKNMIEYMHSKINNFRYIQVLTEGLRRFISTSKVDILIFFIMYASHFI